MQKQKILPAGARKHVREEKSRIRKEFPDKEQREQEIDKVYNKLAYYLGSPEKKEKPKKAAKKIEKKPAKKKTASKAKKKAPAKKKKAKTSTKGNTKKSPPSN